MAGYSSGDDWEDHDDDDYYSDGGCSDEQDDGDYHSDNHIEQQDSGENDERFYDGYYKETDSNDYHTEERNGEPEVHVGGYGAVHYPQQTITWDIGNNQGDGGGGRSVPSYEWSSRIRHQDKQTGSYELRNTKHTFSSGDTFKERLTGRIGFKDEHKHSSTVKIGDRSGYWEYRIEERFRNIRFGESNWSSSTSNGHRLNYDNYYKY